MRHFNYILYDKKEEDIGGEYWKFLDATIEDLEKEDIYLFNLTDILRKISNKTLKEKMIDKIFEFLKEKGLFYKYSDERILKFLKPSQVKYLLEHDKFNEEINNYSFDDFNYQNNYKIKTFLDATELVNDTNWEYVKIKEKIDLAKDFDDKTSLITLMESLNNRKEIYQLLIQDYYEYFPDEYKVYLKMQQDRDYIYKKQKQFMNIDIGIDPKISIGPEIEANYKYPIEIDIYNQNGYRGYTIHTEATVPNGNEIASYYPFHNTKEEVASFCSLCDTMSELGYYYSVQDGNAAGQINLGLDYLDTSQAILNFYEIYGNCEQLLYYISSEEGQIFRQNIFTNSRIKAISEIIGKRMVDEEISREEVIELFNNHLYYDSNNVIKKLQYKKNSVCLRGKSDASWRLEFRIPNGGCNYKTWIDNIRLYGKIMEVSKKLDDLMKKDYLTESEEKLLRIKINLQNDQLSLEEKLVLLMNLLFENEDIRQIYYNRYKKAIRNISENPKNYQRYYRKYEPDFAEVEFIKNYYSPMDPFYEGNHIISYDPSNEEYTENSKKKRI